MNYEIEESLAALKQQDENLSDDDNAQQEEEAMVAEDPLVLAIEDLEGRVVSALDQMQLHPGTRTSQTSTVHEELGILLRPVVEIAAHTAPSIARTYYRQDIDETMDQVYERTISDLILPTILEIAQSDTSPAKRAATLEFFRHLWQEAHKTQSWLNHPYGTSATIPAQLQKRRKEKKRNMEGELLRYWIQAAISCTTEGVFTDDEANSATASRGILAASASLRPSLRHIVQRIKDADDRGANRLYKPVMEMIENVLKKLFLSSASESLIASCIKFLEIVILCCSRKPQDNKRKQQASEDFSLDDLPEGHPVITREALETIAEYAFSTIRGLTLLGGQIKVDPNLVADMMSASSKSPSESVVSILKPAALAYLELESSFESEDPLKVDIDRSAIDLDFELAQKSYSLAINAMSALAINRPVFFREAAICLARRSTQPPVESAVLKAPSIKAITSHLRASCLTLLRNSMSVTSKTSDVLEAALVKAGMEIQATKAKSMAEKAESLKTAGRAARNRANIYYEWETSDKTTKRQRETDDALAQLRAAKKARGLGHGIQLPTSMTDQTELIIANLKHLSDKRPKSASKNRSVPVTLDFVIDAILTNGASLTQEEGKWYTREGGSAWNYMDEALDRFQISDKMAETLDLANASVPESDKVSTGRREQFFEQCGQAAAASLSRVIQTAKASRSGKLSSFGNQIAARLLMVTKGAEPSGQLENPYSIAKGALTSTIISKAINVDDLDRMKALVERYPVAASFTSLAPSITNEDNPTVSDIVQSILNEALLQEGGEAELDYDTALNLYVSSVVHSGELANEKPSDLERKRAAADASVRLSDQIATFSRLTETSLDLICSLCDIADISEKAREIAKRSSEDSIASAAATHAAKVAAEKRATLALLLLRDVVFQRDQESIRSYALKCATGLAVGRLPTTPLIHDRALKLVMNVLFERSDDIADMLALAAVEEMKAARDFAVEHFDEVETANRESQKDIKTSKNPYSPRSDKEKEVMDQLRKPVLLMMAICVRMPEKINELMRIGSDDRADALARTIKSSMIKLSRAIASRDDAAEIVMKVAEQTEEREVPLLLCFMENLSNNPDEELVEACFKIQEMKKIGERKDPRFVIPIVASMKRKDLIELLPDFVEAEDSVMMSALVRMNDRVSRSALLFRAEPDEDNPTLHGMTLCEQIVYLHNLDKDKVGQKRYLAAIKLCLEDDEVYMDRVVMSALDHMSGVFLTKGEVLPLAFMRSCIILVTKHESLHAWIAQILLPRLVEGKIYEDARQWEGWMRCAHMLEKSGESGVSINNAISKLPESQKLQYETKWAGK